MPKIHLLTPQTANLIAAGEVVERPANAVKELLENAIDAGADRISVEIREGGVEWISVSDNGSGMSKEDLPLAIRRHATSKIQNEKDLAAISTLGFRGEALAAISAASRFSILTKEKNAPFGWQMNVEGESEPEILECGRGDGTTVIVRDLFFNQPARKKFLKRPQTEASAILQYVQRIAVSHPEISFQFTSDSVLKLRTSGNGKTDECIYSVYGKEFAGTVTPLAESAGAISVSGFITRPEFSRNNHSYQSFYINSRYVKSRTMQFALEDAYKSFVKSEKYPGCVIFLKIDLDRVDVNVHPSKLEVRFEDERAVYGVIYGAVRKTLENLSNRLAREEYEKASQKQKEALPIHETSPYRVSVPKTNLPSFEMPLFAGAVPKEKKRPVPIEEKIPEKEADVFDVTDLLAGAGTTKKTEIKMAPPEISPSLRTPETADPLPVREEQLSLPEVFPEKKENNPLTLSGKISGVMFDAFILYETGDAVYVIDKHAAHERILYEGLKKTHSADEVQVFLEPLVFSFDPVTADALAAVSEELKNAGFCLEEFGAGSMILRSVPQVFGSLSHDEISLMLQKTAEEVSCGGKASGVRDKAFDRVLYSMACKAAVKAGIPTTESEHEWIVEKLREIDNITVCPHGRPVLVRFTKKHIENLFLRD